MNKVMTDKEIRERSQEKLNQIQNLCVVLHVSVSAVQRITQDGVIENVVIFTDNEKYAREVREPKVGNPEATVIPENKKPVDEAPVDTAPVEETKTVEEHAESTPA